MIYIRIIEWYDERREKRITVIERLSSLARLFRCYIQISMDTEELGLDRSVAILT